METEIEVLVLQSVYLTCIGIKEKVILNLCCFSNAENWKKLYLSSNNGLQGKKILKCIRKKRKTKKKLVSSQISNDAEKLNVFKNLFNSVFWKKQNTYHFSMTKYYPVHKLLRRVLYYDYKKENSVEKQNSMKKKKVGSGHYAELLSIFSIPSTGKVWNYGETKTS